MVVQTKDGFQQPMTGPGPADDCDLVSQIKRRNRITTICLHREKEFWWLLSISCQPCQKSWNL